MENSTNGVSRAVLKQSAILGKLFTCTIIVTAVHVAMSAQCFKVFPQNFQSDHHGTTLSTSSIIRLITIISVEYYAITAIITTSEIDAVGDSHQCSALWKKNCQSLIGSKSFLINNTYTCTSTYLVLHFTCLYPSLSPHLPFLQLFCICAKIGVLGHLCHSCKLPREYFSLWVFLVCTNKHDKSYHNK